jgi:OMF family outer membrane factor
VGIVTNKFNAGISREQDLNNARINALTVKDKLQQLKVAREQQINALKILCDIPFNTPVNVSGSDLKQIPFGKASTLEARYMLLQSRYMQSEMRAGRYSMLPVLSLVYYQGWQQNSNSYLFDDKAKWIQSKYIGLRLTMPIPPDVNKLSQNYTSKVNYNIASLNAAHTQLQNELGNRNLELDVEKASGSFEVSRQIADLKNNNYEKSLNQYREGILSADNLITAFTDLLNSQLNLAASRSALNYSKSRVLINNSFK